MQSPLRIPAGGAAAAAASSACRPRAAPLSANKTDTTLWLTVRSLRRFALLHFPYPLPFSHRYRLESYPAGWLFIRLAKEQDRELPALAPRPAGGTELRRLAPHAARGLGRTLRPDRPQNHRPTQPGALPTAGNENKERSPENGGNQPLHRATCRHSPGRVVTAVRSLPRPRPSRPVDTKSACPLSVLPSPRAPHPS